MEKKNSCLNEFAGYVFANVLGMLGLSCYILADTYFVSKGLGSDGLAALNLAIPIYSFIHGVGLMIGMGGATRYAILKCQGKEERKNPVFTHAVALAVCFAVLFVGTGILFSQQIAGLLGAQGAVLEMSRTYLQVLLLFSPAFLMNETLLCFVRNDGAPQLAMAAMLGGSFSNIILDYIFIFLLDMGIFGAVFATGLAPVISLLIMSPFFIKKKNHFHFMKCRPKLRTIQHVFSGGLPSLASELSSAVVMMVFNGIILGIQGNTGIAAYGVIANLSLVVIAVYTGIAQGMQPLLSKYYGLGKGEQIRRIFRYGITTVVILSLGIYAGMFFGAEGITAIFNSEGNVQMQAAAVPGIRLYFTACLFAGWNIVLSAYFVSTDEAGPANLISILRGFILIVPMAFVLAKIGGMTGLWLSFPVTELLVAAFALVRMPRGMFRRRVR